MDERHQTGDHLLTVLPEAEWARVDSASGAGGYATGAGWLRVG